MVPCPQHAFIVMPAASESESFLDGVNLFFLQVGVFPAGMESPWKPTKNNDSSLELERRRVAVKKTKR